MTIVATTRLHLREFASDDASAMEAVFCDPEVMRYSDSGVQPKGFALSWISDLANIHDRTWRTGYWAVVEQSTDQVIGYAGLSRDAQRCDPTETELSFRLARRYWGQGYATEAAAAMLSHGMSTLNLPRIIAIIDPGNVASVRVAEKIGMVFERTIMLDGYDHPDHVYTISEPQHSRK